MKPIVIYHKNCIDGFGAAYAFWSKFKDAFEYHPGVYGEPTPNVVGRDVYMVDFSYNKGTVALMLKEANSVTLIDHHKTSLTELACLVDEGLKWANSCMNNSGAVLAWNYIYTDTLTTPDKPVPWLFRHIEDRDLWKFELENTHAITTALYQEPFEFEVWDKIVNSEETGAFSSNGLPLLDVGKLLVTQNEKAVKKTIERCLRTGMIDDIRVPLVNAPPHLSSDIGHALASLAAFAATYEDTSTARRFSLRSSKANPYYADVSLIAKKYGGGGHEHAAGFEVDRKHALSRI